MKKIHTTSLPFRNLVSVLICAWLAAGFANAVIAAEAGGKPEVKPVKYVPPARGGPASRIGGASRGAGEQLVLEVIAPEQTGLSAGPSPTLYWYCSELADAKIELTLISEQSVKPVLETQVNEKSGAGINALNLADFGVALAAGEEYQWSVSVVADPEQRSSDVIASATLMFQPPTVEMQAKLSAASPGDVAGIYAGGGYWYDAIDNLSRLIASHPDDNGLRSVRADLMEQADLPAASAYDRR